MANSAPCKVLIVEDDPGISKFLRTTLTTNHYEALWTDTGVKALEMISSHCPDCILLDLGLPDLDGTEIIRRVRSWAKTPIIVISARSMEEDKAHALDLGADDYLQKPFGTIELLARIRVALKKHRADTAQSTGARSAGKLHMEPASYSAGYGGEPINLTKKEFDLLNYLWQHENTAITRDDLLTNVWGYEFTGDTNIVDVYIRYLRQKIDDRFGIKTIHTIRAVGYMFRYEQE